MFEDSCREYLMPTQFLVSRMIIISNVIILQADSQVSLVNLLLIGGVSQCMNSVLMTLLLVFSRSQKISSKCLKSWRYPRITKLGINGKKISKQNFDFTYFERFRKSCKPIALHFGSFYAVTPKAVLRYCVIVLRGTMRLMLAI